MSGPALDADTQTALAVAGVSQATVRLTGDTFQQIKGKYRKMPKPQRLQELSHLQLHIAAIYAVENEDMQRQVRLEQQEKRHRQIDEGRRSAGPDKRARRESGIGDDETDAQSPTARRTQALQLEHQGQQLDPQLMAHQSHSPDDVDPFLHCKVSRRTYKSSTDVLTLGSAIPGFNTPGSCSYSARWAISPLPSGTPATARPIAGSSIGAYGTPRGPSIL